MTTIRGSHAIITGGSEGIGLASARHLLSRGAATVSLIARRRDRLDQAARELGTDRVRTEAADVTDRDVLDAAIERLVSAAGPCDVLITSAGYAHPGRFIDLDIDVFREQMDVNYFGTLHAIRAVVPSMVGRRAGHIVGAHHLRAGHKNAPERGRGPALAFSHRPNPSCRPGLTGPASRSEEDHSATRLWP